VRLLYLDEVQSHRGAPYLCVSGIIIHGDREWPEVDRQIVALIEKHIPASNRIGLPFTPPIFLATMPNLTRQVRHSRHIFRGSKYFDRRKPEWSDEKVRYILDDLARVIDHLSLPVVMGA
jgi:hypothetical protein